MEDPKFLKKIKKEIKAGMAEIKALMDTSKIEELATEAGKALQENNIYQVVMNNCFCSPSFQTHNSLIISN